MADVMSQMEYEHIIYIEQKDGEHYLCIDRLLPSGQRDFMTHIALPKTSGDKEGIDLMEKSAKWLGNSILIDSPSFREHIGINE